jgi:superfamily I DNA/RNA helicase
MSEEAVVNLAKELSDLDARVPMSVKLAVIRKLYQILGFRLSNDLLLALLVDVRQQMILAPAGGCKTTSSQVKLLLLKIFWSKIYGRHLTKDECLCLVYNAENRPQMERRHVELLSPLFSNGFLSFDSGSRSYVNVGITAHTLHSFCWYWIRQYLPELGIVDYDVVSDGNIPTFFSSAVNKVRTLDRGTKIEAKPDRLQTLYDLVWGLQLSYDEVSANNALLVDAISGCGLTPAQIKTVFAGYDSTKRYFQRLDFTDMLVIANKLFERQDVQDRLHALYTCVVVDEVQDFTPLMMSVLRNLVGPSTRFLAIGDEDQSIYGFRGADVDNAVRFTDHFPDAKLFQLVVNRRCGQDILDSAAKVIELNSHRFPKRLVAEHTGGTVRLIPYHDDKEQLREIAAHAQRISRSGEIGSSVVCAREKSYGQPISFELFQQAIPFHMLNATRFDRHEVFRGVIDVLNLLHQPVRDNWKHLYKVLNVSRKDWLKYIDFDEKRSRVTGFPSANSLWELKFEPFLHYAGFIENLGELHRIGAGINTYGCAEYLDFVVNLFQKNFWRIRADISPVPFAAEAFGWLYQVFSKPLPYPALHRGFVDSLSIVNSNERAKNGVAVATFHALKGLEYRHVLMSYLEDSIFPAYTGIENRGYAPEVECALKEAENRLAYVAMTRAIDELTMYYNSRDPSSYIALLGGVDSRPTADRQFVFSNRRTW